jgi:solute carrier family 25 iron transporter 28/37
MGTMPAHAAFFSIYELSKRALGVTVDDFHPMAAAVVGITATLAHDSIMTPADTLKQRL